MRIKSMDEICGGEVLAQDVVNDKNEILIPAGIELKADYVPLIQSLGLDILMIDDPYEKHEKPNFIIDSIRFHTYVDKVKKLMEGHIYHNGSSLREFEVIANEIVKEVNNYSGTALMDMNERAADLYEHTVMVTLLSVMIAKRLKLNDKKQFNIAIGALLHDIGIRYITVPYQNRNMEEGDPVLIFEYKKHTIMGYSALEEESWVPDISRKMILFHHERIDGSGFPMRQRNREIECRVIQVCDAFDCMISGMECIRTSVRKSLSSISNAAGVKYDEEVTGQLLSIVAKYPVGTILKTKEGKESVVISQTTDPENPVLMEIER